MSDLNDIVAVGLDLSPKTLLQAYAQGVFPWPSEGMPLLWYCPKRRGVLEFSELHIPNRLKQYLKKSGWQFTCNRAFEQVIDACSERGDEGTWITAEMKSAYLEMHRLGHAHSVEVWQGKELIGGLYGVDVAGYFAGESMFHRADNASKAALLFVIALQKNQNREFMDIQVLTPHMEALGAKEISRTQFKKKLAALKELPGEALSPFRDSGPFYYKDFSTAIE
jgi:leucyl/phenylalanyl-tRNA--protein transferase